MLVRVIASRRARKRRAPDLSAPVGRSLRPSEPAGCATPRSRAPRGAGASAPLVGALDWLKYLSPFYYYAGNDPLAEGVDLGHIAVLALLAAGLTVAAAAAIDRRDLRA